ncbi:DASH complex subunit ASK1 [Talaromyces islandicus]|uniref:DASH complex subunit ASK1 n=1 Tax=Talaromyces islandicus TaxID=28573 RepID=A0A0U1M2G4_TALIS|nr:DASH complex subunit ASK1 [Talaromyces islandicus]
MSGSGQRNLTLTEELEKLEQSITLTLQEIDSNFSRAHRIVTTSILPVVEQYAEQSKDVWEGAKFWKQFFESSANVSLSGYEEQPNEDTEHEQTVTEDSTTADTTTMTSHTAEEDASYETPSAAGHFDISEHNNDLDISSLTISPSHSTPRPAGSSSSGAGYRKGKAHRTGGDESPSLMAYHHGAGNGDDYDDADASSALPELNTPVTPGRYTASKYQQDLSETPMSSPFIPPSTAKRATKNQKPTDPVLHHVLDKTYRVQATPLSKSYKPTKFTVVSTPKDNKPSYAFDDSPISSPELEAPKLHEEIFSSPLKGMGASATPGTSRKTRRRSSPNKRATPKPGVSVLTPGKPKTTASKDGWDSDDEDNLGRYTTITDDDDDDTGAAYEMSPPKTMQFHIPHSRLMKTPAKEASKRIVSDLLATAGGGDEDDDESYAQHRYYYQTPGGDEAYSPTVVRSGARIEDDTF